MNPTPPPFDLKEVADLHTKSANLYHSVGHILRTKIRSGEWKVGQKIPSERRLSESLHVSRATVRQGIENLVKEGILRKEQGRGTFIAPPKLKQGVLRLLELADILRDSGLRLDFELLGKELIVPTPDIAARLKLSHGESMIWLQRLLHVNDSPMLIETSFIPTALFPEGKLRQELEQLDGRKGVRDVLIEWCGVHILRAHETFEPVILEDAEAHQLGVEGGAPALWVETLAFDIGEQPVAYTTILIRGDRCRFYTDITFG